MTNNVTAQQMRHLAITQRKMMVNAMLSDEQLRVFKFLEASHAKGLELTSALVMVHDKCSIQNAYAKLLRLYEKGYLTRKEVPCVTGGNYWLYMLAD